MFIAIMTQLEVWFIGIPILVIVGSVSAEATYLGRVLIIWTFAVTMVVTIIGSKCMHSYGYCLPASENTNSRGSVGSGIVRVSGLNMPVSAPTGSGRAPMNVTESTQKVTVEKAVSAGTPFTSKQTVSSARKSDLDMVNSMSEADLAHEPPSPEQASDSQAKDDRV